ncbi:8234_t:CDS:2 [Paraglomus brasilianum]|uniref:8234_t:CDS:1 n=1 Tax=Paraglomus brasilianum TaxID=144538 RepID=A0A9N9BJ42_9GLOM|nr:8234_t:CDS:2 [Paraglomus brasilianum]
MKELKCYLKFKNLASTPHHPHWKARLRNTLFRLLWSRVRLERHEWCVVAVRKFFGRGTWTGKKAWVVDDDGTIVQIEYYTDAEFSTHSGGIPETPRSPKIPQNPESSKRQKKKKEQTIRLNVSPSDSSCHLKK